MLRPATSDYCHISPEAKPRLVVVIDTEEEFDWSQSFSRSNTSVQSMRWIDRVQTIFDAYGITPVYVIDYPITSQPEGYQPLVDIHADGRCIIGAHLHPWVNPPFEEEVNQTNSFAGNLPGVLEHTKLRILSDCIGEKFGSRPKIYKAGRYGVGPHTAGILEQEDYEVDLSVCPYMNYAHESGPDYSASSPWPYWFGTTRRILELPLTVGYTGLLRQWGPTVHPFTASSLLTKLHVPGILARLQLLNKSWLSPEGYLTQEHCQVVRTLFQEGLRVFSFAFHSPSVAPGHTPYVQSDSDLEAFLNRCRHFFDFFFGEMQGIATTPIILKEELRQP